MDGRVNFSAMERSRLLGATLGHLGPQFPTSDTSHSSALSRLGAASAAAAAAGASAAADLARAGSPTGLAPYAGRYLPSAGLQSPGASYAMMAGYLGHTPETLKNLPELQQYYGSQQYEEQARYLLSMYYPYLPYLPATESLSMFAAQNSASAQAQATAQARAVQHRIYDLQKEAMLNAGALPVGFFPPPLGDPTGQLEATNLSVPGSKKVKSSDKPRECELREKARHSETHRPEKEATVVIDVDKYQESDSERSSQGGSERTRGINSARYHTEGKDRKVPHEHSRTRESLQSSDNPKDLRTNLGSKHDKIPHSLNKAADDTSTARTTAGRYHASPGSSARDHRHAHKLTSPVPTLDLINPTLMPNRPTAFHSPTRQTKVRSPDKRSGKIRSPERGHKVSSPLSFISEPLHGIQDAPENLCVKDSARKNDNELRHKVVAVPSSVKTQSIVTDTTVTVTSTLTVITSGTVSYADKSDPNGHAKLPSPRQSSQISPSSKVSPSSQGSSTSPTYPLPYYHNLFSRTQPPSQDGKKVHAVTYVPEVGCLSSPVIGISTSIESAVSDKHHDSSNSSKRNYKHDCNSETSSELKHNYVHKPSNEDTISNQNCGSQNAHLKHSGNDRHEVVNNHNESTKVKCVVNDTDDEIDVIKSDDKEYDIRQQICVQNDESKRKELMCVEQIKQTKEYVRNSTSPFESTVDDSKNATTTKRGIPDNPGSEERIRLKKRNCTNDNADSNRRSRNNPSRLTNGKCDDVSLSHDIASDNPSARTKDSERIGTDLNTTTTAEHKHKTANKSNDAASSQEEEAVDHQMEKPKSGEDIRGNSKTVNVSKPLSNSLQDSERSNTSDLVGDRNTQDSPVTKRSNSTPNVVLQEQETTTRSAAAGDCKHTNNVLQIQKAISTRRLSKEHSSIKTQECSQSTGQSIPVGIAVARQRIIAPKSNTDKDSKGPTEDGKHKAQTAVEIKPVRPLKVIQPSKGASNTTGELKNVLPANLVVTGGAGGGGNVFWPDDPASRQIATQFLQTSNQPITAPNWYAPGPFVGPQSAPMGGPDSSHMPMTVPPGYKLAQDSLTGQILLIPVGTEVIEHGRVIGGFPVGHAVPPTPTFPRPLLTGQSAPSLHSVPAIFTAPLVDRATGVDYAARPHYPQVFTGSVLTSDGSVTDADGVTAVTSSPVCVMAPTSNPPAVVAHALSLTTGQEKHQSPVPHVCHDDSNGDKMAGVSGTSISAGLPVTAAQTHTYKFPAPALPLVTTTAAHAMRFTDPEVTNATNTSKAESAAVQSRGTSPMLSATDSSNDENDDPCSQHMETELSCHTHKESVDKDELKRDQADDVTCDIDAASAAVKCDNQYGKECDNTNVECENEVKFEDELYDAVPTKKSDDTYACDGDCDTSISDLEQEVCKALTSVKYNHGASLDNDGAPKVTAEFPTDTAIADVTFHRTSKRRTGSKTDRNIFSELTEYNPFTDPQILQATDGLELLSALAEKTVMCPSVSQTSKDEGKSPENLNVTQDENGGQSDAIHAVKEDLDSITSKAEIMAKTKRKHKNIKLHKSAITICKDKNTKLTKDTLSQLKPRVRCGHAFKPKKSPRHVTPAAQVRMTTFCGIQIPEDFDVFLRLDDDVIDSMEQEMKMRLAELQRMYREKQRQLSKLKPKKEREKEGEKEKDGKRKLKDKTKEIDTSADSKRGPGRPKKRRDETENADTATPSAKQKAAKKDAGTGSHSGHGSCKKKNTAELIVDRVFRKTGSSFKIPLSKNVTLIAPARIELPGVNTSPENTETRRHKKSLDFGKLIKRSRLSQLNGKDRSFAGGLWHHRKEEKRKEEFKRKEFKQRKEEKRKEGKRKEVKQKEDKKEKRKEEKRKEEKRKNEERLKEERKEEKRKNEERLKEEKRKDQEILKEDKWKDQEILKEDKRKDQEILKEDKRKDQGILKEEKRKEQEKRNEQEKQETRKDDKQTEDKRLPTLQLPSSKPKMKQNTEEIPVEHGLGLLAEYAVKSEAVVQSPEDNIKPKTENNTKDEKSNSSSSSPNSPSKKRKPGRPKKCDSVQPGVTETIVAKQSKHMDFFRFQVDEPKPERKISLEGKTPLKPLYLDEWNVRRSERIFLSDPSPSPQTSPNITSPMGIKVKQEHTDDIKKEKPASPVKIDSKKKAKLGNIQNITEKVKKKYATGFSQKSRDKSTDIFKTSRDKLTKKRQEKKMKELAPSPPKPETTKLLFDKAHVEAMSKLPVHLSPSCVIGKDELVDGMRILTFMEGLFHEAELQAIRPPDIYGAVLNNERRTRPHICSQEEILKDAIKDVQPPSVRELPEGTRICAYWSQQFSCLYPGTISKASPNPDADDETVVNVEFDDGDSGTIPLEHIRMIPQDFPVVEYDPHPLLLLTKRRRTVSISEGSEQRKSNTDFISPSKDTKVKRPPGRPSKADRMVSVESMGDEDVFIDEEATNAANCNKKTGDDTEPSPKKRKKNDANSSTDRQLWTWSGSSTKRPGLKGKARKDYYKSVVRDREILSVGDSAVFVSTGRPNLPYVGHIDNLYEGWGGQMVVKVKWFYHPEETKGGKRLQNTKGALFRSDHEDENDVQTISHKCHVLSLQEYNRRKDTMSVHEMTDVYYLAGAYQPTVGHIDFESGVV